MFIEILKYVGSAALTAFVTIYALHIKRKWEKQDKQEETNDSMGDKLDNVSRELGALSKQVAKLSADLDKEMASVNNKIVSMQAGLRETLYDSIKTACKKYESEGRIREEEYKSLHRMWDVYHHDLNGNGYLDGEMDAIEKLEKY